jgi:hypothetical protein
MSKLEQLTPNAAVRGILPDGLVTVVSVQWFGSEAVELTYKSANGKVANELLYRDLAFGRASLAHRVRSRRDRRSRRAPEQVRVAYGRHSYLGAASHD